jgi:hypothetical protein
MPEYVMKANRSSRKASFLFPRGGESLLTYAMVRAMSRGWQYRKIVRSARGIAATMFGYQVSLNCAKTKTN